MSYGCAVEIVSLFKKSLNKSSVIKNCAVLGSGIIGLMTKSSHPYYFPDSEQKLTGIVCHASAYKKPILIHEELATLYRPYLGEVVEIHNEAQSSFDKGLDRLIEALNGTI